MPSLNLNLDYFEAVTNTLKESFNADIGLTKVTVEMLELVPLFNQSDLLRGFEAKVPTPGSSMIETLCRMLTA